MAEGLAGPDGYIVAAVVDHPGVPIELERARIARARQVHGHVAARYIGHVELEVGVRGRGVGAAPDVGHAVPRGGRVGDVGDGQGVGTGIRGQVALDHHIVGIAGGHVGVEGRSLGAVDPRGAGSRSTGGGIPERELIGTGARDACPQPGHAHIVRASRQRPGDATGVARIAAVARQRAQAVRILDRDLDRLVGLSVFGRGALGHHVVRASRQVGEGLRVGGAADIRVVAAVTEGAVVAEQGERRGRDGGAGDIDTNVAAARVGDLELVERVRRGRVHPATLIADGSDIGQGEIVQATIRGALPLDHHVVVHAGHGGHVQGVPVGGPGTCDAVGDIAADVRVLDHEPAGPRAALLRMDRRQITGDAPLVGQIAFQALPLGSAQDAGHDDQLMQLHGHAVAGALAPAHEVLVPAHLRLAVRASCAAVEVGLHVAGGPMQAADDVPIAHGGVVDDRAAGVGVTEQAHAARIAVVLAYQPAPGPVARAYDRRSVHPGNASRLPDHEYGVVARLGREAGAREHIIHTVEAHGRVGATDVAGAIAAGGRQVATQAALVGELVDERARRGDGGEVGRIDPQGLVGQVGRRPGPAAGDGDVVRPGVEGGVDLRTRGDRAICALICPHHGLVAQGQPEVVHGGRGIVALDANVVRAGIEVHAGATVAARPTASGDQAVVRLAVDLKGRVQRRPGEVQGDVAAGRIGDAELVEGIGRSRVGVAAAHRRDVAGVGHVQGIGPGVQRRGSLDVDVVVPGRIQAGRHRTRLAGQLGRERRRRSVQVREGHLEGAAVAVTHVATGNPDIVGPRRQVVVGDLAATGHGRRVAGHHPGHGVVAEADPGRLVPRATRKVVATRAHVVLACVEGVGLGGVVDAAARAGIDRHIVQSGCAIGVDVMP